MRILLADSSDLILEWLREMLSAFEQVDIVAEFKNGTDTLAAIRTLKPDLAIVEAKMPGLSGLEILVQIRKEDKRIKFIILTFYAFDAYRQSAVKAGVDYYFSKVDDFEQVALVVADLLAKEENSNVKGPVLSSKTKLNPILANPE